MSTEKTEEGTLSPTAITARAEQTAPMPDAAVKPSIDVAYTKAFNDALALMLNEPSAAWARESDYKQPDNIIAGSQKLHEEHVISAKDIDRMVDGIAAEYAAVGITPAEIEKIRASFMSNIGAPKSQLAEMRQQITAALISLAHEASGRNMEGADAKEQMLENLNEYEKRSKKSYEDLCNAGYRDKKYEENRERIEKEQAKYEAGSKEWNELEAQKLQMDAEYSRNTEKKAHDKGDAISEEEARRRKEDAEKMKNQVLSISTSLNATPLNPNEKLDDALSNPSAKDNNQPPKDKVADEKPIDTQPNNQPLTQIFSTEESIELPSIPNMTGGTPSITR